MKKYERISFALFIFSALVYLIFMFGNVDLFPGQIILIILTVFPIIGLILAFSSKSGGFIKVISIIGNLAVLMITVIVPVIVTLFFWNQP
ncbi:UNVERIFIED_ORG: cytochrome c oxidase subunit IV [Heyndrickxia coagulans]